MINELFDIGAIKIGLDYKLKSGMISPIYIDLRIVPSYPELFKKMVNLMFNTISSDTKYDCVCGVPYTALPIATVISVTNNIPLIIVRKEIKDHGTKQQVEGHFKQKQNCLLIEDLVTTGGSVMEVATVLRDYGLKVSDILVLIDREQGGSQNIMNAGYRFYAVFTISEILNTLVDSNRISPEIYMNILNFILTNEHIEKTS